MERNQVVFLLLVLFINLSNSNKYIPDKEYAALPPIFHIDNYDKCMLLHDEALYCSFEYHLEPLTEDNKLWKSLQDISKNNYNYNHSNIRHWICVPLSCPNYDKSKKYSDEELKILIKDCYDEKIGKPYGFKGSIHDLECKTENTDYPVDWLDIFALIFFVSYILLVATCTAIDLLLKSNSEENYNKFVNTSTGMFILAFSVSKNWYRLKTVHQTDEVEYLRPIQGVRFYSTVLVILSHTAMASTCIPLINTKYVEQMVDTVGNMFLSSGPLCVSGFFFLSSVMLSYGMFTQFEKKKLTSNMIGVIFFHRYIRLTPAMAVIILFNMTWWRHMGSGPFWSKIVEQPFLNCRENWWTNLLFLNTDINKTKMCTPTFWYLALDTQYFLLLLILIYYIKKHEKHIWQILGCALIINVLATFTNNYINDYEGLLVPRAEMIYMAKLILENPQWHGQMASFIGNTCGPIMGVGFGYLIYKTKGKHLFKDKKLMWEILFYIFGYGPALGVIFVTGWYVLIYRPEHEPVGASLVAALARPIYIFGVAFGIFAVIHGIGGPSKHVLRFPPIYVLGRIAYSSYLVHFTVISTRTGSVRSPIYGSDYMIMYNLFADFTISYAVGTVLTLLFELPMSALQKMMMPKSKDNKAVEKEKDK